MRKLFKENSHKYIATLFQIAGIGCFSGFGTLIYRLAIGESTNEINLKNVLLLFVIGSVFFVWGWYIMFRVDKRKAEKEELINV